jgi:hypothetical protein
MKRELELELALVTPAKKKPMFSNEAVTQLLVRFITANDQVSFSGLSPTIHNINGSSL